jgi:hypothetical protein
MKYKKISIQEITDRLSFADWNVVKDEINLLSGFKKFLGENDLAYKEKNRIFSFENFYFSEFIHVKGLNLRINDNFEIIKRKIKSRNLHKVFLRHESGLHPISVCDAHFICPGCEREYVIEGNPAKNFRISTSICGKCQKAWLHKFKSYQKNYEASMLKKHGVKRPLQKKEILQKACETRMKLYGVAFPMQREDVKVLHANNMLKKWGRTNYFSGLNAWKEFDTFKNKGFVSKFESCLSKVCIKIFGEHVQTTLTKKSKFCDENKKYYAPDFYDPVRKIIIEFNGDFFHANPELYDSNKVFNSGKTFEEVRARERERFNVLNTFCDSVYVIWENNWKKEPKKIIQVLKEIKNAHDEGTLFPREKLLGWQP